MLTVPVVRAEAGLVPTSELIDTLIKAIQISRNWTGPLDFALIFESALGPGVLFILYPSACSRDSLHQSIGRACESSLSIIKL